MITRIAIEQDGDRLLLRLAAGDTAVLDVLTDAASMAEGRYMLETMKGRLASMQLGTFGPFPVMLSMYATGSVALAVDGPDFGDRFRGNQSVVLYSDPTEMMGLLTMDPS